MSMINPVLMIFLVYCAFKSARPSIKRTVMQIQTQTISGTDYNKKYVHQQS